MNLPRVKRHAPWLVPAALFAVAPKCVLCVLAYAGLGAALGLAGPELCGAPSPPSSAWLTWFTVGGIAAVVGTGIVLSLQRSRSAAVLTSTRNPPDRPREIA